MRPSFSKPWVLLLPAGLWLAGCHPQSEPSSPAPLPAAAVTVQAAMQRSDPRFEEVAGTVRAKIRSILEAKVAGRIAALPVIPGQAVQAGELLVKLEAQEWQARFAQAAAARDNAARDLQRLEPLLQAAAVTQTEYDAVTARFRMAEAGVEEAQTLLSYSEIKAPFAGTIARKWADPGDLATPGRPLLELENPQALQLEAHVPESLLPQLHLGQTCPVHIAILTNALAGRVAEIPPSGDPSSRTFLVKFDLPDAAGLRSGQFGRVDIPAGTNTYLRVARSAVQRRGQLEFVYVVDGQTAHLRLVRTGRHLADEVELLSGVDPNDLVVVEGAHALVDGQPVKPLGQNPIP